MKKEHSKKKESFSEREKILLVVLPYWDPLIPPQGISHLKRFLRHHDYEVVTKDANTVDKFKTLYDTYFNTLKKYIPPGKRGNFYNIGHDVLRNHMMAFMNRKENDSGAYVELIKEVIYYTFYTRAGNEQITGLDGVLTAFYRELENYTLSLLEEVKPGVLGISVFRDTLAPSLFMFKLAREKFPRIRTVMGGSIFADILMKDTPNFEFFLEKTPYIDHIIIGEGQRLLLKLLRGELPRSQKVFTLADIDGQILDFSPLNTPDMSDFDVRGDYPYLSAKSSVSCPFKCGFCNVNSFFGAYRKKEPQQVVEEMTAAYKEYGSQLFFMTDSLLNYTADGLAAAIIESPLKFYWDGYIRVDREVCDMKKTMLWRRGGFYRARLGVESGSPQMLEKMNKKITTRQIRDAVCSLANAGIKTTTYWVVGYPGETEAHFRQTLDLLEELRNFIYEAECNVFTYIYSGQAGAGLWQDSRKTLYPDSAKDMLVTQTWVVDTEPSREESYRRVNRFIEFCNKLAIPNPYSLYDIYKADHRWRKLQKNAVPALVELKEEGKYIDDTGKVEDFSLMENTLQEDGDFGF